MSQITASTNIRDYVTANFSSSAHQLKTDPAVFDAVASGAKTFEIRFDDRGFKVGDMLHLQRTQFSGQEMREGKPLVYTGESMLRDVTHILRGPLYGLADGWVIMSLAGIAEPGAVAGVVEALRRILASAEPHPAHHPSMHPAWVAGRAALARLNGRGE